MGEKNSPDNAGGTEVLIRNQVREPRRGRVFLLNDDYTTMDFVVHILMRIFNKNLQEAEQIMLVVHHGGRGECGVYTLEIAETKVRHVRNLAKEAGFPLRCDIELI